MGFRRHLWAWKSYFVFFLAPILLSPVAVIGSQESKCAYVVLLMATYWISECLPVGVTSLLPVVFFPFFEIMSTDDTAGEYMTAIGMIGIGGLMTALAIEYWALHKRVALRILTIVGSEPRWLMLGMMLSTWCLSMWISNTASSAMMIPISEAILVEIQESDKNNSLAPREDKDGHHNIMISSNDEDEIGDGKQSLVTRNQGATNDDKSENGNNFIVRVGFSANLGDDGNLIKEKNDNAQNRRTSFLKEEPCKGDPNFDKMAKGMLLSICYSANCGGMASLTGTGPNLVLKREIDLLYETNDLTAPITFGKWFLFGLPLSFVMLISSWLCLQFLFLEFRPPRAWFTKKSPQEEARRRRVDGVIRQQYNALGPLVFGQVLVGFLFVCLVALWVTRDMGGVAGWSFGFKHKVKGGTSAIMICIFIFGLPSTLPFLKSYPNTSHPETHPVFKGEKTPNDRDASQTDSFEIQPLLTWEFAVKRYPWSLLLLIGGGLCISAGCKGSGLSSLIGHKLTYFKDWNSTAVLFIICYISASATEFASNTATSSILLPILQRLALSTGIHPLKYMLAACLACSFAFMLPVATAPNAIAFNSGRLRMRDMMKAGIVMNMVAVPVLVGMMSSLGGVVFDFDNIPHQFFNLDNNDNNSTLTS